MSKISNPAGLPDLKVDPDFIRFYDRYAPILWSLIASAHLEEQVSERILVNTFLQAGQHHPWRTAGATASLSWLLRQAYQQGLPTTTLNPALFRREA